MHDLVATELRRLQDRLMVLGPGRLVGRYAELTALCVQQIANLGAAAEHQPERVVPDVGGSALVHQLTVVTRDVVAHDGDLGQVAELLAQLRHDLAPA